MRIIESIDIGNHVECDFCSKDYTGSDEIGGLLFGSKGVCPDCSPALLISVKEYNEQAFIKAYAKENEPFREFILRLRNGNNQVITYTEN